MPYPHNAITELEDKMELYDKVRTLQLKYDILLAQYEILAKHIHNAGPEYVHDTDSFRTCTKSLLCKQNTLLLEKVK